jgi:hypothetical protein
MSHTELFKTSRLSPIHLPPVTAVSGGGGGLSKFSSILGGGGPIQLSFSMHPQTQSQWCWSAVTVSISVFYLPTSPWTQCSLVSKELGDNSCCIDGSTPGCDRPWTLNTALARTNNLQTWTSSSLLSTQIEAELNSLRPIGCRIGWHSGGGHFVVISGYLNDGTVEEVTVDDPYWGRSQMTLAIFTSSYRGSGSWTHSYYTKG